MPWRGAQYEGEFPSLGWLVADWIEANCVVPDGEHAGTPYKLTDEMVRFLVHHYRLKPDADPSRPASGFRYRRSQLVRPQKWGKGPFSAAIILAEAAPDGPVLFSGWDAAGEPVGKGWASPHIQCTACSEDQADNVFRALLPMIELGGLAADVPDTGETRINLPSGGRIEPTTASGKSRLGQRITFALQDETHSWLKANGGHALADTQRRNLAGMGGRAIETTNCWDPAEESVAQLTDDYGGPDVYRDRSTPPAGSFRNQRDRRKILRAAYGGSWWVDLDRVDAECAELVAKGEQAQAERFFGNRIVATADTWLPRDVWDKCHAPGESIVDGDLVTLGFDGARFDDSTALVACRLSDGLLETVGVWERPEVVPGGQWEVDTLEVDAAVADAFRRWRVVFMYADPPYWQDSVAAWSSEHGDKVVREWWTNRERAMVAALERFSTAAHLGELSHTGDEVLARHVRNARKRVTRSGVAIRKDRPGSPNKIDAAVAAVLAYEARADAVAAGRNKVRRRGGGGT